MLIFRQQPAISSHSMGLSSPAGPQDSPVGLRDDGLHYLVMDRRSISCHKTAGGRNMWRLHRTSLPWHNW